MAIHIKSSSSLGSYFLSTQKKIIKIPHKNIEQFSSSNRFFYDFLQKSHSFSFKNNFFSSEPNIQHTYITMSENAWTLKKNGNESKNILCQLKNTKLTSLHSKHTFFLFGLLN